MLKLLRGVACCSVSYAPAQYLARYTGGQSAWTGGVAGDDEREELGREVSDYELEGEEDDQPDEMTVDTGEGGPPDAADGGPPDGEDGSDDESDGRDVSGGGGGGGRSSPGRAEGRG